MKYFSHRPSSCDAGFSLLEIMVTLAVLAIAAGLAAPSLLRMAPNMALKSATRDLYSRLYEAKMLAIKKNSRISVRFNSAHSFYYIDSDGNGSYTPSATDTFTDANGDGAYNPGEPYRDVDGNRVFSGETAINFKDYGYGINLGCGNAMKNWNGDTCNQTAAITFNSRGTSGTGTVYLENRNKDISFAVTVISAGAIKARRYSGATPFDLKYWD
jgi:prepilin-type N-terminal cleavage/methylation domain-containing protein